MTRLEIGEEVLLENNESYACWQRAKYQDKEYVCLMTVKKPHKIEFAEEILDDDLKLIFVKDEELKNKLTQIVTKI